MISADMKSARRYARQLKTINRRAVPYAIRQTVNDLAFGGRAEAVKIVEARFTTRNKWTTKTINVERAKDLSERTEAVLGSTQEYMARQELGGYNDSPVPTPAAAGEPVGARTRQKVVRKQNRTPNLNVKRRAGVALPGRVRMAIADRTRLVKADRGDNVEPGIYRVKGGTNRNPGRAQLVMVKANEGRTRTPAARWLTRAGDQIAPRAGFFYTRALQFQLNRMKSR